MYSDTGLTLSSPVPGRATGGSRIYGLIFLIVSLLFSAIVLALFLRTHKLITLPDMVYGSAAKPYVYRTLLPTAARLTISAIPDESRTALLDLLEKNGVADILHQKMGWKREYFLEYGIVLALMYLSLVCFIYALKYLSVSVFLTSKTVTGLMALVALAGLPYSFRYYGFLYDFTTLFLFTLCLGLMVRQRWRLFCLTFFIACVNKETTILITLVFVIHFLRNSGIDRALFKWLVILQIAMFSFVKVILYVAFKDNPGGLVEFHFDDNLRFIGEYSIPKVVVFFAIALILFYKWSAKPTFLKHAIWIFAPVVLLVLAFGYLHEWRAYYEVYPIAFLLLAHSVSNVLRIRMAPVERTP